MPQPENPHNPSTPGTPALHAPWRMSYMMSLSAANQAKRAAATDSPATSKPAAPAPKSEAASFFRDYYLHPESDDHNHVIARTGLPAPTPANQTSVSGHESGGGDDSEGGMILLNKYPYANGHLLVALAEPRPRLLDYTKEQRAELWRLTDLAVELCEQTLMPQGVNVGLNQATAAGAGVPEHVHVHVVPRWLGDVNFITVVGQVRVIPGALDDMYGRYREVWRSMAR